MKYPLLSLVLAARLAAPVVADEGMWLFNNPPSKYLKDRYGFDLAKKSGLKPQVVTLYQGGAYHLYLFKKYTDVRLVFAPEQQIAFYGGDPDNFEYPRYDLDLCLFRVYEGGKPVRPKHYLKWAEKPVREDDLVFVSGHPGRTRRLSTVAELEYLRDTEYPFVLQRLFRWEVLLS